MPEPLNDKENNEKTPPPTPEVVASLLANINKKDRQIDELTRQLNWFKRQIFGQKSEKRDMADTPYQTTIADLLKDIPEVPEQKEDKRKIDGYERGKTKKNALDGTPEDSGLRFSEDVPVKEIVITPPELEGEQSDDYEIIRYNHTYRLAQQPGSHVVLKYSHPVIKKKSTQKLTTYTAPANVFEKSLADVSFLAGMLVDKFVYHLPLHRQHQRLEQSGIVIARSTLTNLVTRSIQLLKPIYQAQLANILLSKVLAIDETPVKAGRAKKGKLKQAYFWPIYGELDEVCFTFSNSRATQHLFDLLGDFNGTVLSDGYCAYNRFVEKQKEAKLANCWVHSRRKFEELKDSFPKESAIALGIIGRLYTIETQIKEGSLSNKEKLTYRQTYSAPIVDKFFAWCYEQAQRADILPKEGLLEAVAYVRNREAELRIFLSDADVSTDTNHVERALRVIPMGKKNWLFAWTEVGAELIGIVQSLLVTCRLHDIDPYDYFVDVLQRVSQHPASKIEELTPRIWKEKFADKPLRSDLFGGANSTI